MKQIKISSFFSRGEGDAENRKRPSSGGEAGPSGSSQSAKVPRTDAAKKRKAVSRGKSKTNKENGFAKLTTMFAVNPQSQKPALSPKKLTENVIVKPSSPSPAMRELDFDLCGFDEPMIEAQPEEAWYLIESDLALNRPVRCEVLRSMISNHPRCEQIVLLRAEGSEKRAVCRLRDMWTFLGLNTNDKVTVNAAEVEGAWVVNAQHGYVILYPDMMMPITALVNGMFCLRRGVLTNLYKNVNSNVKQMLMGRVLHDVLQETLKKNHDTEEDIMAVVDDIINSKGYLREFYLSGVSMEEASLEAVSFVPKILNFIQTYLKGSASLSHFKGQITEVMDIEEMVTSSNWGIQGRVDVTVRVQTHDRKRVMPLELKTGRASFSKEHRIQVIVYTLLLDEIFRNVESGLLLYLREGVMEEVKPDFVEIRHLLMLRNEFVKYQKDEEGVALPDPIRSKHCSQCTHSRVCASYLRHDGLDKLPQNHPIKDVQIPDLEPSHVEFFMSWVRMVFRECRSQDAVIDDLSLEGEPTREGDDFRHVFRLTAEKEPALQPGCYVTVGTANSLVRGKIADVGDEAIAVILNKPFTDRRLRYRITASRSNLLHIYLTNLAWFLESGFKRLRELIVDRAAPSRESMIHKRIVSEDCLKVLKTLNREQQRAVFTTEASNEYLLIKGPPGTGKTETIVALIKCLYHLKQTVLITGHTHSSIDHILRKLDGVEYVRFGSLQSVDPKLHPRCFARLFDECKTSDDVKRLYSCRVMASTCLGLDLDMMGRIRFDVCIMDESSQVMQVEAIRPLLFCKKFVLVGDSNQLPPVVKTAEAKKMGMDVSIFERLEADSPSVTLTKQYRMNRALNDLANDLAYDGQLECGSEDVAEARLKLSGLDRAKLWLRDALSPETAVVFLDTSEYFDGGGGAASEPSNTNACEAGIVVALLEELTQRGVAEEDVGVITPFCLQVHLLKAKLESLGMRGVDVSTVDKYQGRDKDVIIFSCVKHSRGTSVASDSGHILSDKRRLTVAVTRAKVKLIVVGDVKAVSVYPPMTKLLSCIGTDRVLRLENGVKDFFWTDFA